tara:strand:+ start:2203 stop:3252 length:1050 start_codon:yes stop_codon:yes gene_type:complete
MEKHFKLMGAMIFGCLLGFLISYWDVDSSNSDPRLNINKIGQSYSKAIEKASPAVVNIYSEQIFKNSKKSLPRLNSIFDSSGQIRTSLGSGVILSSDGYILTNQHVVGKESIRVVAELTDGRKFITKLVGIDEGTDLAVLKIDDPKANFPSIELEDSDKVNVGDIVLAIGNPYGLGQSVSMGIISATGREFDNPYSNYLQTDASINLGNSGGALIDSNGRLIGINTLIRSSTGGSEGIGLAIPSTLALEIISDLIQYGEVRRGWLGFSIDKQNLLLKGRIVISQVTENGPAAKGGLKPNDVLVSINNEIASYENLYKTFARSKPGDKIFLETNRDDQIMNLSFIAEKAN